MQRLFRFNTVCNPHLDMRQATYSRRTLDRAKPCPQCQYFWKHQSQNERFFIHERNRRNDFLISLLIIVNKWFILEKNYIVIFFLNMKRNFNKTEFEDSFQFWKNYSRKHAEGSIVLLKIEKESFYVQNTYNQIMPEDLKVKIVKKFIQCNLLSTNCPIHL